ncbi:MAG: hypothetical protein SWE60_07440, partial [Thermodesulfobacteriota bacterium]|nr:hypothetical protein [Thermodesulfobacteriota bacterium]
MAFGFAVALATILSFGLVVFFAFGFALTAAALVLALAGAFGAALALAGAGFFLAGAAFFVAVACIFTAFFFGSDTLTDAFGVAFFLTVGFFFVVDLSKLFLPMNPPCGDWRIVRKIATIIGCGPRLGLT